MQVVASPVAKQSWARCEVNRHWNLEKTTKLPFAAPEINGGDWSATAIYTHFPLCCSHAQQTLSRPQPVPTAAKKTSLATNYNLHEKGVSAGTCNQKHPENMHLATAGRVRTGLLFRAGGRYTHEHETKMNYISKQGYGGRARLHSW